MDRIGKYRIVEELGRGGMGVVYKAYDSVIGREVAIKLILERALAVPMVRQRFYREARSAGRLTHDNITIIYDVGEEDDRPYLVMEYLEGQELREAMNSTTPFSLEHKLRIAAQICQGLDYAHRNHVIHRDIKPENIFILKNGRAKIMDFGIARLATDEGTLTQANSSIGTPKYMSPEQVRGEKVDHRSDIFSVGVVLYEMVAGFNPFSGDHVTTIIYKILNKEPEPINLEEGLTHLSETIQLILQKSLAKDRAERYQSCADLADDLQFVLKGHSQTLGLKAYTPATGSLALATSHTGTQDGLAPPPVDEVSEGRSLSKAALLLLALLAIGSVATAAYFAFRPADPVGTAISQPMAEEAQVADEPATMVLEQHEHAKDQDATIEPSSPEAPPPEAQSEPQPAVTQQQPDPNAAARRTADGVRGAMDAARRLILERRSEATIARQYEQAQRHRAAGIQHYDRSQFEQATQSFRSATGLFEQMRTALDEADRAKAEAAAQAATQPTAPASTGNRSRADDARSGMARAKSRVADALHATEPYKDAAALEQQGGQAYERRNYDQAQTLFARAEALFNRAALLTTPQEQAMQNVRAYASHLKRGFENEDVATLASLSDFYKSFGVFFKNASDVEANIRPGTVRINGTEATVDMQIELNYKDNRNQAMTSTFTNIWTLQQQGSQWVISNVSAR